MSNNQIISSPSERLQALSESFKDVIKLGQRYTELLDQLAQTSEAKGLLDATTKLAKMDLSNAFVNFPPHYQAADYCLIFMQRLLKMHGDTSLAVKENQSSHEFEAYIEPLNDQVMFKFELDQSGEAAFTEQSQHEPLFYLNLADKIMQFNNRALINYFIIYALKSYTDLELRDAVRPLIKFALYLEHDLDFTIDLGVLATNNESRFMLAQPELALTVIDRLFVATADQDYMLMNLPQNNGAELILDEGTKLDISFDPDDYSQQWAFEVKDPDNKVSFFDVLLHYELVRQWYLHDRQALAVQTNHIQIADDSTEISDDIPVTDDLVNNDDSKES